jgi:hypothetical protein
MTPWWLSALLAHGIDGVLVKGSMQAFDAYSVEMSRYSSASESTRQLSKDEGMSLPGRIVEALRENGGVLVDTDQKTWPWWLPRLAHHYAGHNEIRTNITGIGYKEVSVITFQGVFQGAIQGVRGN